MRVAIAAHVLVNGGALGSHVAQYGSQPSPLVRLPSSHASPAPGSTTPSPQRDAIAVNAVRRLARAATAPRTSVQSAVRRARTTTWLRFAQRGQRATSRQPRPAGETWNAASGQAGASSAVVGPTTSASADGPTSGPCARITT